MIKQTLEEWKKEAIEKFGENPEDWKFVCPACGNVASGKDFKEAGAEQNDIYCTCIGRHNRKESTTKKDEVGCDWAAYGLFQTLGKGRIVVTDEGKEIQVFDFANN
jgi:hypothetical protein